MGNGLMSLLGALEEQFPLLCQLTPV